MKGKRICICALTLTAFTCFGVGASMVATAESTIDESKFTMYQGASVRTEGTTLQPNATGLRFQTIATEFKEQLQAVYSPDDYEYNWYTQLRFTMWNGVAMDGDTKLHTSYEANVPATVWRTDGWNTVLLGIPDNAVALDITAQSFVEVIDGNGDIVYDAKTVARTYSAAQTASYGLAYGLYQNDEQKSFMEGYVNAAVESGEITSIELTRPTFGVEVGASDDIIAHTVPFGYGITYKSDNESVATVDNNGRVTGVAAGTANITLSVGSLTKTCAVTVVAKDSVPAAITSWTNADPWTYTSWFSDKVRDISSQMYPFYHRASDSTYSDINNNAGVGQVTDGKIKLTSVPLTAYYTLNSDYLADVFALSKVKAVRVKITGMSAYKIAQFKLNYGTLTDEHIRYEQSGNTLYLQFNRSAYETYLNTRASDATEFIFRMQFHATGSGVAGSGTSALVSPSTLYIEEIAPIYDGVTEDFEYGASAYITADNATVEKITERTNGRGMYALNAQPTGNTLTVNIASTYAGKVFTDGITALQFRVYTDKDLTSVTVNGLTTNVQYVYNADGEYYTVRVGSAYSGSALSVVVTAEEALGSIYLDAFTATTKALGANVNKTAAYAKDNGGETEFVAGETFNFYAYGSLEDGVLDGEDYDFDEPTLEDMLELKEAGFTAIMPQSAAAVSENGAISSSAAYDYKEVLDLAEQAGLKVILTDNPLLYLSAGKQYDSTGVKWPNWKGYYESEKETSGEWAGAAVASSTMYAKVQTQLENYINHPAFGGVLMVDEPRIWMLDESLENGQEYTKSGTFGFTYKTVKRVAQEVFGKDIFIHANVLPAGVYSHFNTHAVGQLFPELTVARYGEITGMDVSSYAVDSNGYATSSTFYTDLESYIELIGASDAGKGNNALLAREVKLQISRERYGKYCEKFLEVTGASYLMPDIYPVYSVTATDRHLMEIQTAAEVAAAYGVDLHLITQSMMHVRGTNLERQFKENDARWLNNILLSYGVKNIVYFTYHIHGDDGSGYFDKDSSFVDETGEKTNVYYFMQEIMSENKAFEKTYQAFDIVSTKTYYETLAVYDGEFGKYAYDIKYNDGSLYVNDSVSFTALTDLDVAGELSMVSEFQDGNGRYMYAVMNVTDGKYASDSAANQTITLTFGSEYTHVILWRNGEKKLVALDANHSLEIDNAAGEAVYVIPYTYDENDVFFEDDVDNGVFFPGNSWAGEAW